MVDVSKSLRGRIERGAARGRAQTRVISVTGGKGGVGKTLSVVNLAIGLARCGKSVMIMDADLGLANVDIMLGISPRYTVFDLLSGERSIEEILVSGPEGITIIPAASGIQRAAALSDAQRLRLFDEIERIAHGYDYLLIDTQAGIGSDVLYFSAAANEILCVVTPDPTSITDAYALIKVLAQEFGEKTFRVLINNVSGRSSQTIEAIADKTFDRLARAVEKFLQVELDYVGHIPADEAVPESIRRQRPLLEQFPSSPAGLSFTALANKFDEEFVNYRVKGGMQFFFRSLLESMQ
jgi:flagellar biosynthesis protein FlhG